MKLNERRNKKKEKKGKSGEHMDNNEVIFSIICRMKLANIV